MKPRPQSNFGSLDSLLDTMTNVVGILVIILVVTILGMKEAVGRISEQLADVEMVSLETYDAAVAESRAVTQELQELRALPVPEVDLSQERDRLAAMTAQVEALREQVGEEAADLPDPAELERLVRSRERALEELRPRVQQARRDASETARVLAATPVPVPRQPDEITIPNPRPAPQGASAVIFICQGGRVIPLPREDLLELGEQRLASLARRARGDDPLPCEDFIAYFERVQVRAGGFRLGARRYRDTIRLRVYPEQDAGESVEQIQTANSRFRLELEQARRGNNYARFIVHPDSYEVYLQARAIVDEADFPAGWVPVPEGHVYELYPGTRCTPAEPLPPQNNNNNPDRPRPLNEPPID